jgi:fluoride exporter
VTAAVAATAIACGGVAALVRYLVAVWFSAHDGFPWAVLTVNVVGSALGGVVLGLAGGLGDDLKIVLLSGVAGGLTTFSTFSVETVQLFLGGRARVAALNIALNLGAGIAVAVAAFAVTTWAAG